MDIRSRMCEINTKIDEIESKIDLLDNETLNKGGKRDEQSYKLQLTVLERERSRLINERGEIISM